jgi:hypothetical protein
MIKLTKLILSVKDSTEDIIENLSIEYSNDIENAENLGLSKPKAPKYKMTLDDYDTLEVPYYVVPSRIIDLSIDSDGITVLGIEGLESDVLVKESIEDVLNLINDAE